MTDNDKPTYNEEDIAKIESASWQPALPPSGHFFYPNLKLARARTHINTIEQWIKDYAKSDPVQFRTGVMLSPPDFTKYTFTAMVDSESRQPPWVGLPVGDAIHNLRTALDAMAGDLAIISGNSPNKVYFPFADTEDGLKCQIKRKSFHRAGKDCVALLYELQPFKGGNTALRALHDLDNIDKHITVCPVVIAALATDLPTKYAKTITELQVVSASSVLLTFPPNGPLGGQEIIPSLHHLAEVVEGIIKQFATLVANRS